MDSVEGGSLFHFHDNPSPECPVGRNIHRLLDGKLQAIQEAMEEKMRGYTIADLKNEMSVILQE